jgi:tetratricopeptide (TPR) repeat protein
MDAVCELTALITQLREDLAFRRIDSGMKALEENRALLAALDPTQENAAVLVGFVAQWVDIGFGSPELVRDLLRLFPKSCRACLPLLDYLHLRMAEGLLAMTEEEFEQATAHFQFVQAVEEEIRDAELPAIANFWIGRCLRKQGRYDDALTYTIKAKAVALDHGYAKMAAVMQVLESWLYFQKGKLKEAAAILREAEAGLSETDDFIARGNIHSAYGRIARRQGRYDRALEHFERAIEEYKRRDPQHSNLARVLVNTALVKRLSARQIEASMDEDLARRRSGVLTEKSIEPSRGRRSQILRLRAEASAQLSEALGIYEQHHNHRGIGSVFVNRGLLHADEGELDEANAEGAAAFRHGEEKRDFILMARARMLQCSVENARLEEQIDEDAGRHSQMAHDFARDAVEYAQQTQNRRLLARALVWQGLTYCADSPPSRDAARRCYDAVTALLRPAGQEYDWEDLETLKTKVLQAGRIDAALQEWSEGQTGDKTFQQITEEFAAIVIPRVWEREGRKISRVASTLCISPKKVRRILQAAGLVGAERTDAVPHS